MSQKGVLRWNWYTSEWCIVRESKALAKRYSATVWAEWKARHDGGRGR